MLPVYGAWVVSVSLACGLDLGMGGSFRVNNGASDWRLGDETDGGWDSSKSWFLDVIQNSHGSYGLMTPRAKSVE
ncbi:uncharacterized protein J3D65DRAFT_615101 [Phyllosticta citribraziliensis]|uniref:Secreted protein n=1 Tax=Phyllosticta citribraziliensis TaxID=989973 RepID=A0ABR1M5G0_9PEZI